MTEEVQTLAEVEPAPAPEVTATPETAPEVPAVEEKPEQTPEEKKFTQAELDAILDKRFARERKKWEREQQAKQAPAPMPTEVPSADQFDSPQAYAEFIRAEAEKLVTHREAQKQQAEIAEAYHDREDEARGKYDDFDQVAYNPKLPITDAMAETIRASEIGPELAYHLGSNPKEAERISKLSPFLQAKEIGRIEAKLAAEPPVKKTSSVPEPIRPVTARITSSGVTDTTDPRAAQNMNASDWIEADRRRQIAKLQAQRNR
jgi:hypothetical protein